MKCSIQKKLLEHVLFPKQVLSARRNVERVPSWKLCLDLFELIKDPALFLQCNKATNEKKVLLCFCLCEGNLENVKKL